MARRVPSSPSGTGQSPAQLQESERSARSGRCSSEAEMRASELRNSNVRCFENNLVALIGGPLRNVRDSNLVALLEIRNRKCLVFRLRLVPSP